MVDPAFLVGGFANAPALDHWRPAVLGDGCVNPNGLILRAEPSANSAGFKDGIIATPPDEPHVIIGRVKATSSRVLAPLMRSNQVAVEAHFEWSSFNFKAWRMRIDVFGADPVTLSQLFSEYVDFQI